MKKIFLIIILGLILNPIFADIVDSKPFKVAQPNGDSIIVIQRGDEYGSWYETINGYVIDKNSYDFWVYVKVDNNGNLILTDQIARSATSYTPIGININSVYTIIDNYRQNNYDLLNNDLLINPNLEDAETAQAVEQGATLNVSQIKAPAKNNGTINVLTILIQFQDVKFKQSAEVTQGYFNRLMNDENFTHPNKGDTITGSVREYWEKVSYGQLSTNTTVVGPYTANFNRAHYGRNWTSENNSDVLPGALVYEAVCKAAKEVDMAQFDNNDDGIVDFVHIVFAGISANEYYDSIQIEPKSIWPHQGYMPGILRDWVWVSKYIITSELNGEEPASIGTICHEMGHAFGAPDFYDRNEEKTGGYFAGTGYWDLMANGNHNDNGHSPAHPNPYVKTEIFKWATAKELEGNDSLYTLRPSEIDSNSIYKLSTSTPGEYYLLENRQDSKLPGIGLVVYHINAGIENVLSSRINIQHPQNLYVVDANNHIEKPTGSVESYGDINSRYAPFWNYYSENMYFTSTSLPSNCAWDGTPTENKDVCFISEVLNGSENLIKFVLNPEISGPDILCDSAIYSIKYLPSNANIKWSYVRPPETPLTSTPLLIGWGKNNKNVCFKRGNNLLGIAENPPPGDPILPVVPKSTSSTIIRTPYSGSVTIKADIFLDNDTLNTFTLTKDIYMPEPVIINDSLAGDEWKLWQNVTLSLKSPKDEKVNDNEIKWYIQKPGVSPYITYGKSISLTPLRIGKAIITAQYVNGCNDEYMSQTKTYLIKNNININMSYANPVSGESVEINVTNDNTTDNVSDIQSRSINHDRYMGAYRLELWHEIYGKVREMNVAENTPTVTMNVDGLSSGIYILRLIIDNEVIETSQMIIK